MGVAWTSQQRIAVVWGGMLLFLTMEALERTFSLVFTLNFDVAGPNWTAGLVLLLATAYAYPLGLHRFWPHDVRYLDLCAILCVLLPAGWVAPWALVALASTTLWHMAATPLIFALTACLRRRTVLALALAIAIRLAVRAWSDSAPMYATQPGMLALVASAVGLGIMWFQARLGVAGSRRLPNPGAIWAFLFATVLMLGTPAWAWTWSAADPLVMTVGALAGVGLGATVALRGSWAGPARAWEGGILALAGAAWLLWAPWFPAAGLGVACFGALLAADSALDRPRHQGLRRHGWTTGSIQLAGVVLVFLYVGAGNWAFMPLGGVLQGRAGGFLFALIVLLLLADARRRDWGVRS